MFFSVVVPVLDKTKHLLPFTLDSIVGQTFDRFEIIVVDGQAEEHDLHLFDAYKSRISEIAPVPDLSLFAMMNKGAGLAKGDYLHFLLPGEFYLSCHAFTYMAEFIEISKKPDLVATGYMLRHSLTPTEVLMHAPSIPSLKGGNAAPTLQPYWLKKETFQKFNPDFEWQGGFDLLCRIVLNPRLSKVFLRRVLTDYEYRKSVPKKIIVQFWEAFRIICRYFGWSKALFFWMAHNQARLFSFWLRSIKAAFWKR